MGPASGGRRNDQGGDDPERTDDHSLSAKRTCPSATPSRCTVPVLSPRRPGGFILFCAEGGVRGADAEAGGDLPKQPEEPLSLLVGEG